MYIKIPKNTIDRIEIVQTGCKKTLAQVVKAYSCDYAINGGLYEMKTGEMCPIPLRVNGKTIATSDKYTYWTLAWNDGPDICMAHSNDMEKYKYVIACSEMINDGAATKPFCYTSQQGGVRGRTAIGHDKDNIHLFVTTNKNGALSPNALQSKMLAGGAKDAIMLDGGGSAQMYALGQYYQAEKRKVANWILVWLKKSKNDKVCPYVEPTKLVKSSCRGEDVMWVQWYLDKTTAPGIEIDGIFGKDTKKAVIEFQKTYGLAADALVGAATRRKMKALVK